MADAPSPRELIEQAHQIRQMQETGGWLFLADRARERATANTKQIISGSGILSFEDYHRKAGWVEGVLWILDALLPQLEQQARQANAK